MSDIESIIGKMKKPLFMVSLDLFPKLCEQFKIDLSNAPGNPKIWRAEGRRFLIKGTNMFVMIAEHLPYTDDKGEEVNMQVLDLDVVGQYWKSSRPLEPQIRDDGEDNPFGRIPGIGVGPKIARTRKPRKQKIDTKLS